MAPPDPDELPRLRSLRDRRRGSDGHRPILFFLVLGLSWLTISGWPTARRRRRAGDERQHNGSGELCVGLRGLGRGARFDRSAGLRGYSAWTASGWVLATRAPQRYRCGVALPDLDDDGVLPPGIHVASWEEVVEKFGGTAYRAELLAGLLEVLRHLRQAGCRRIYLDGSFVTAKEHPADYDLCWDLDHVDLAKLPPVVLDVSFPRVAQKARYHGDILPNVIERSSGAPFVEFFQRNKVTGGMKGIVAIDLEELE
jgi:hypothetical protein